MKLIKTTIILPFILGSILFFSCNDGKPDVSDISANVTLHRFDKELFACRNINDVRGLLMKNKYFTQKFYQTEAESKNLATGIWQLISNPAFKSFYQETQTTFGDLSELKTEFENAFKHIKYYYPDFKEPKIYTTVTGLSNDLYVSDSLIVISLDAFVGPKASFRPQQPAYILKRYQKEYIVPTIIQYLSGKYNEANTNDGTLLADMVYYGKAFEFTKAMMPNTADSLIIGYSEKQLVETEEAQDLVWAHFIDNKLIYETKPPIKEKYMSERPFTNEIGQACPGSIGHWLGWKIVNKYRSENTAVSLRALMKNKNAQEIFEKSKYRPQ